MGHSGCCRQCGILIWKNFRLRLRGWVALLFELLLPPAFTLILVLIRNIVLITVDLPAYNETTNHSLKADALLPLDVYYDPPTSALGFLADDATESYFFEFFENGGANVYMICDSSWVQNTSKALVNASLSGDVPTVLSILQEAGEEFGSLNGTCQQLKTAILPFNSTPAAKAIADKFTSFLVDKFPVVKPEYLVSFDSSAALDTYLTDPHYGIAPEKPPLGAAIVFNDVPEPPPGEPQLAFDYSIRLNGTIIQGGFSQPYFNVPFTNEDLKPSKTGISSYYREYWYSGFLTLQTVVDAFAIQQMTGGDPSSPLVLPDLSVAPFPTLGVKEDPFWSSISTVFALFMVLSLLVPVANIVKSVVLEKEERIKAGMLMMAMSRSAFYCSYLATYLVSNCVLALLLTLASAAGLFVYSNFVLIFLYYFLFLMAAFSFCFFLSSFFNRARVAQIIGILIWFATYFPYYALTRDDAVFPTQVLQVASLLPVIGFAEASNVFASFESGRIGVQLANVFEPVDSWSFADSMFMMWFDVWFYFLLGMYLDQVVHSDNDVAQPLYFCCLPRYWCPSGAGNYRKPVVAKAVTDGRTEPLLPNPDADAGADDAVVHVAQAVTTSGGAVVEPVAETLQLQEAQGRTVSIRSLVKSFVTTEGRVCCCGGGRKRAVDDLDLTMYEGQVTALLGHNGAGKTTTISILTGLQPMTSGSVSVRGLDVERQLVPIRRMLGVCPQHNILWDNLTVLEHMQLFAALKGVSPSRVKSECEALIREVGLTEKTHVCSSKLSGGMKRKLSVAIAMLGGSRVVLLDEPTSGMDPWSRRFTWRVIKSNRQGRIIVLTTHFMDEADLLGDRIAIMSQGKLICNGSSLFLKNHYGVGYSLVVVKKSSTVPSKPIVDVVRKHVRPASAPTEAAGEISFRLPLKESSKFESLLTALQEQATELGVNDIGLGVTTLEEVFTRVGHDDEAPAVGGGADGDADTDNVDQLPEEPHGGAKEGTSAPPDPSRWTSTSADGVVQLEDPSITHPNFVNETIPSINYAGSGEASLSGSQSAPLANMTGISFCSHVQTMLVKRARYYWRDGRAWCCQVFLPVGILLFGLMIIKFLPSFDMPNLVLDTSAYNPTGYSQTGAGVGNLPLPVPYLAMQGSEVDGVVSFLNTSASDTPDGDMQAVKVVPEPADLSDKYTARLEFREYLARTATPPSAAAVLNFSCVENYGSNCSYGFKASRYGGYVFYPRSDEKKAERGNISALVMCNSTSLHAAPIFVNALANAQARTVLANKTFFSSTAASSASRLPSITVSSWPFPDTKTEEDLGAGLLAVGVALMTMMSLSFVPASFALFIVREREFKQKHQQNVSGLSLSAYWFSSYLWDFISYLMPFTGTLILFAAFGVASFTSELENFLAIVVTLGLYGLAVIPFTYVLTFFFKQHTTAWNVIMLIMVVTGVMLVLASYIMAILPNTEDANKVLVYVYRIFPPFCLGQSLLNIANLDLFNLLLFKSGATKRAFDMDISGANSAYLAGEVVVYYLLVLLLDSLDQRGWSVRTTRCCTACFRRRRSRPRKKIQGGEGADGFNGEDDDVIAEAARVRDDAASGSDTIRIIGARKEFGDKVAVHNLSLGIPNGECFGLLGINGAGKTTTISMLTGEFPPTEGQLLVCNRDVAANPLVVRRLVGYCPQFDALFSNLTGREHLLLYGKLKGIPSEHLEDHVAEILKRVGLEQNGHANKLAGHYSGGNKRKLSVGVAMIGNPKIIFLDEPSTGMDPVARRKMWDIITQITTQQKNCCAVLTTHSMDECSALCSRVGIMVSGRIMCLGTLQHLKARYGHGYQLDVGLKVADAANVAAMQGKLFATIASTAVAGDASRARTPEGMIDAAHLLEALKVTRVLNDDESIVALFRKLIINAGATHLIEAMNGTTPLADGSRSSSDLIHDNSEGPVVRDDHCVQLSRLDRALRGSNRHKRLLLHRQETAASVFEESQVERLRSFVSDNFLGAEVKERQGLRVQFQVSLDNDLPRMFGVMERSKAAMSIVNYSISQTSLESIFNAFAAKQKEETQTAPGMSK